MDLASAKMIGAGLACIALVGAGIGIGNVFSSLISAAARNPAAQAQVQPFAFLGFALAEATGLFGLAVAFLILFVFKSSQGPKIRAGADAAARLPPLCPAALLAGDFVRRALRADVAVGLAQGQGSDRGAPAPSR